MLPLRSLPSPRLLRLTTLTLLPALVLVVCACALIFAPNGLLQRRTLQNQLHQRSQELAELQRANQHLVLELRNLERDPVLQERMVADELRWARPGSTVVVFDDGPAAGSSLVRPAAGRSEPSR